MRLLVALFIAASLMVDSAAAEQLGRNPFVPSSTASAPKEPAKREASASAVTLPRLPNTSPGLYRSPASFIPPPPVGIPFPALQLPPPEAGAIQAPTLTGPRETLPAPLKEERKSDVFMTRDQLELQRAKCSVVLKSSNEVNFSENGGRQVVKLTLVGGRQCVKGVAASHEWVDVSSVNESGELVLVVPENDSLEERESDVNIANTGTSLTIRVRQAASKEEFRQLKL